jgi:ribonuclease-3
VYFRGERLAKASGHSIQQAEMNAAKEALESSQGVCTGMKSFLKIW